MLKKLFERERVNLNYFFDQLDYEAISSLLEMLLHNKGMIYTTGMGKSGLVAEKIAQTLTSTGSRAFFLSPINALHGDIGIVHRGDIILMFSKSGESDELLHLIPLMRNKGVRLIAVVNRLESRLSKACELTIMLPIEQELCPFNLCPTISSTTQMIFGDVLTVALMMEKEFTLDEYMLNHSSGRIGRRLTLRVRDLMLIEKNVPITTPGAKLVDVLVELSSKRCGCVLVVSEEKVLLGIFTDGDLRRALEKYRSATLEMTMEDIMTKNPRSIGSDVMASEAVTMMEADQNRPITVMPVVDELNHVVGLIKLHDIIQTGIS